MSHPILLTITVLNIYNISIYLIANVAQWRIVMRGFVEQLRLAEKAAEDIYFAKVNRELIESLHKRMQAEKDSLQPSDQSSTGHKRKTVRLS